MAEIKVGPASFGYKREGGRLVLHPDEAPIRLRIFELFAEHERKKTVAEILNAEGYTTRAGVMFTAQTITRLLVDDRVMEDSEEVDALVPKELWQRCNAILQSQKNKGGVTRKVTHLFSGFVYCECSQKMYVPSATKKYICSDCRRKISSDDLEEIFYSQLQTYNLTKEQNFGEQSLYQKWPSLPFENKRRIIESITQRIEVTSKKVTCFLFTL